MSNQELSTVWDFIELSRLLIQNSFWQHDLLESFPSAWIYVQKLTAYKQK